MRWPSRVYGWHKYDLLMHALLCALVGADVVSLPEASSEKAAALRGRQRNSGSSGGRRTSSDPPVLGDSSNGLALSLEEVVNGRVELEGRIPSGEVKWISDRVQETIAIIVGVPLFQVIVLAFGEAPVGNIQVFNKQVDERRRRCTMIPECLMPVMLHRLFDSTSRSCQPRAHRRKRYAVFKRPAVPRTAHRNS
jgi:hypothetical protein